jgi:hypothetical protein
VTPCRDAVGYHPFFNLKMEAVRFSETSYHITAWDHNPEDRDFNLIAVKSSVLETNRKF